VIGGRKEGKGGRTKDGRDVVGAEKGEVERKSNFLISKEGFGVCYKSELRDLKEEEVYTVHTRRKEKGRRERDASNGTEKERK